MEKLLTVDEVADYLGVTKATIYCWTSQKKIPHVKLTKRLLKFREKEIVEWISQKSVSADAPEAGKRNRQHYRPPSNLSEDGIERIIRNAKDEVLHRS